MNHSNPLSNVPLPAARIWSLLALAALPSVAHAAPVRQVVTAEVVAVPTPASGFKAFLSVASDQAGSWVAGVRAIMNNEQQFYGVLAGSGTTVPSVLRVPQTLGGFQQEFIFSPRVQGSRIAYTAVSTTSLFFSSWIDDQLIAQDGDLIGTTGLEWRGSRTPRMTSTSRVFVMGSARLAGTQDPSFQTVVRYPAETLVISSAGSTPSFALSGPVTTIHTFESSPNGNFWVAVVSYDSATTGQEEMAIIDTGFVYTYGTFTKARTENSTWQSFEDAYIDDSRRVVFHGKTAVGSFIFRDGVVSAAGQFGELYDVDADGFALMHSPSTTEGLEVQFNGLSLERFGAGGVDANGNGFPDAGWAVTDQSAFEQQAAFLDDGRVLTLARLQAPGSANDLDSLVIASLALPNDVVCQGVPNSTARSSSLRAVGVDRVAFNDLELQLVNAPVGALSIPLVSKTSGFLANPGGSTGNICLGGTIGRGNAFTAAGSTTLRVYPQFLPQPSGFTAALAGETWFFQVWHRDAVGGVATSNFSSALAVTFR